MATTKKCLTCGKEYKKLANYSQRTWLARKYCSRECRKLGEVRKCLTCSKEFYAKRCYIDRGWLRYCSISCAKKGKIPPNLKIAQANSPIQKGNKLASHLKGKKRPPFSEEWLEKLRLANIEKGKNHSGEKHWNWHGGISGWQKLLRGSREYREWRLAVYERDRWTCQECGRHCDEKTIVAHHKKSFKEYPELRYERDNGVTLCRKCHLKREREAKITWTLTIS